MNIAIPKYADRKEDWKHSLKQIVPNSRIIVLPPSDQYPHWTSRLYVTPSALIVQVRLLWRRGHTLQMGTTEIDKIKLKNKRKKLFIFNAFFKHNFGIKIIKTNEKHFKMVANTNSLNSRVCCQITNETHGSGAERSQLAMGHISTSL